MMTKPNCPDETISETEEPYHFMTTEELLEKEERIRQASLEAYKQKCKESREKMKNSKSKIDNEWKRLNSAQQWCAGN